MDVELITNPEALPALRPAWDDLLARCSHVTPFMSYEWVTTWWKHFGRPGALRVACVRDQGELIGIAPLQQGRITVRGVPLLRCLSVLGGKEADYKGMPLDHARRWEAAEGLLQFCQEEIPGWDLLLSRGLHQDSPTNYLLPVVSAKLGLSHRAWAGAVCPYVPLQGSGPDSWPQYRRRGIIKTFLRARNRLQQKYGAVTRMYEGHDAVGAMREFLRLHEAGWQDRGGSQAIPGEKWRALHLDLALACQENHMVRIALLETPEGAIAAEYMLAWGPRVHVYLGGLDPSYRKLSPGSVIRLEMMDEFAEHGYDEFDIMRGEEAYKFYFTQVARTTVGHAVARSAAILRRYELMEAFSRAR
jgi:CelD/BcsL family acetyltransferase involved in cellulose biosynthesis